MSDETVTLVSPDGKATTIAIKDAGPYLAAGFKQETSEGAAARIGTEARQRDISSAETLGQTALSGATLGLSDAAQRAFGGEDTARYLRDVREAHPTYAAVGNVIGAVAPALLTGGESIAADLAAATPIGRAAQLGRGIAAAGEGGGAIARIGYKALGGAAEGGLIGAGQGVSELALDDHPLTWERAASAISSNALFGAGIGGAAGLAAGTLEHGLSKARGALDEAIAARQSAPEVAQDLAGLDQKGLRAARETELDRIEGERVPARKQLADDINGFREDLKQQKIWLATKDATDRETREIGKLSLEADKMVDRTLRNPIALAEQPKRALAALQQQENALQKLVDRADPIRAGFAADQSGARAAALDAAPGALERNRALQARIKDLAAEAKSPRLAAIEDARDALSAPTPKKSLVEEMLSGTIFHKASEAAGGLAGKVPLVGGALAPIAGAKLARFVTDAVFGRLAKATTEQLQGTRKVVDAFTGATTKGLRAATPLATKTLASVRFGPEQPDAGKGAPSTLAKLARERSAELRQLTAYDETGTPRIRPEARAQIAAALGPIRHAAPVAADRIETVQARKIEAYAAAMPRKTDIDAPIGGPDRWGASDFANRGFARVIAVGENPADFERRCVSGRITPEECEAYRRIYPERLAHMTTEIMSKLPTLQRSLPYSRRLSLSMLTGAPVDPAMHPAVLTVLQTMFRAEPGSSGGTMAPKPMPQFGSVKKSVSQPTPAQKRGQGG